MTPDRRQQIEKLYHSASQQDAGQRATFLNQACAGDEELQREVGSLLERQSLVGRRIGPYEILSPVGVGGMGEVYRAKDTNLEREVAIKVLPRAFLNNRDRLARFRREAQLLASLNHPHIATIHGLEESDGSYCLVMELVPGQTLADRLLTGSFSIGETLQICGQIAEALGAAHQKGITHRDIKPANIKVTPDGRVKVLDFGLAKSLAREDSGGDQTDAPTVTAMTQPGVVLGTPAYMSPEQVRGELVDQCTDIWAFGCVLYELLTGRRLFSGGSVADIIAGVLKIEPDWHALPAGTPVQVRDLLRQCLQKDSQSRLQEVSEARIQIEEALRAPTIEVAPEPNQTIRSLAVLPFANSSGDPQMEYLSDGLTESIILNLSQLPQLRVMARSAVFRYKGRSEEARESGRALGVGGVLTGTVLQRGETLLISAELVDVQNGWQLWGAQYRRKVGDIFAMEEEIAREISGNLRLKLTPEKQNALAKRYTENVEAYHLYLKGRFYWGKRTEEGLNKAIQYFRESIEADPTYALAYAGLAEGYVPLAVYCHSAPKDALPKARAAAHRALEIDPMLSEARTVLGAIKGYYDWDPEGSEKELLAAIEMNPNYPRARQALADCFTMKKQFAQAAAEVKRALELDPLSLHMNAAVVMDCYFGRQYDQAIEQGRAAVELDKNFYPTRFYLGLAYQQKGLFLEAATELEQARVLSNNSTLMVATLGGVFAAWGEKEKARKILHELEEVGRRKYVSQVFVAPIYAGLGDRDLAFACLEKAYDDRCSWLLRCLMADPRLDSLRSAVRFQNLVRRMGFVP